MIPNSSKISGSSLIAPLVSLSKASPKSLPRALAAPFAILANPVNSVAPNPPDIPSAAPLKACSIEIALPVISRIFVAKILKVLPL